MDHGTARRFSIDWPHLIFLVVIAGATLWYLMDAVSVSTNADNLLLVAPLSILALGLCATLAFLCFRPQKPVKHKEGAIKEMGATELRSFPTGDARRGHGRARRGFRGVGTERTGSICAARRAHRGSRRAAGPDRRRLEGRCARGGSRRPTAGTAPVAGFGAATSCGRHRARNRPASNSRL